MRKLKGGMRRSKLSTRRFIPWFGLPQRRPYIHVVEAITKSIASGNQVYSVNTITVTLILLSTKELAHKGRGSPRPRTRFQGVASHQMLQGADTPKYLLIHSKTSHRTQHLALTLSKELILALTLKLVLSLRI